MTGGGCEGDGGRQGEVGSERYCPHLDGAQCSCDLMMALVFLDGGAG